MFYVLITQMIANEQNFPVVLFISDGSNITLCVSLPYWIYRSTYQPIYRPMYRPICQLTYLGQYISQCIG